MSHIHIYISHCMFIFSVTLRCRLNRSIKYMCMCVHASVHKPVEWLTTPTHFFFFFSIRSMKKQVWLVDEEDVENHWSLTNFLWAIRINRIFSFVFNEIIQYKFTYFCLIIDVLNPALWIINRSRRSIEMYRRRQLEI
jgi:hypothetical protein